MHAASVYAARRQDKRGMPAIIRDAMAECGTDARRADAIWRDWCDGPMPRVPGVDTVMRIAVRLWCGRSVEYAAKEEYLYRMRLALESSTFGVPHPIGM